MLIIIFILSIVCSFISFKWYYLLVSIFSLYIILMSTTSVVEFIKEEEKEEEEEEEMKLLINICGLENKQPIFRFFKDNKQIILDITILELNLDQITFEIENPINLENYLEKENK